jgi:ABC-type sugar transport system substrate-binding protein
VQTVGRTDVKIYGINGEPAAIKAIQRGDMTATIFLDVYQAGEDVALNVPKFVAGGVNAKPQNLPVPGILVDKDTIAAFLKKYPTAINP